MATIDELIQFVSAEPRSSRDIQRELSISQPTLSRMVRRERQRIARLGAGRATRYLALAPLFGSPAFTQPLFGVAPSGVVTELCAVHLGADGSYLVSPGRDGAKSHALPFWLLGESNQGHFPGLPYFLEELRPAGFMGRALGRRLAARWRLPPDPRSWSDHDLGRWLLAEGDALPGNLLVGELARERYQRDDAEVVVDRAEAYPKLTATALDDGLPGSSAAGEQPKFAIRTQAAGHVLVKFSPAGVTSEARRWQDLLRCEHHALTLLRQRGRAAVESELFEFDGRVFLETKRFDRHGAEGRSAAISLGLIDAEFTGLGHGWSAVAEALASLGLLSSPDLAALRALELFGHWIGNTDMHLGNVALAPHRKEPRFALQPIYDMLPMGLAPRRGEVPEALAAPLATCRLGQREPWTETRRWALEYWLRLSRDPSLTADLRAIAETRGERISALVRTA